MGRLFPLGLLFLIVGLSGCTDIFPGGDADPSERPLSLELYSELPQVRASEDEYTYLTLIIRNPSEYDLYTVEDYGIKASVVDEGLFESYEAQGEEEIENLQGIKQTSITWKLTPRSDIPSETNTRVWVRAVINKEITFPIKILFASRDYLAGKEMAGEPVPNAPKTMHFSDNYITMTVDLNRAPPVVTEKAYANIYFSPLSGGGVIKLEDWEDNGDMECNKDYNPLLDKALSCTFSGKSDSLTEEIFYFTVKYTYTVDMVYPFRIIPSRVPK
jgi:hypothetical protein